MSTSVFTQSRHPHTRLSSPQTFVRQLPSNPGLTRPANSTLFFRLLLEAGVILRSRKLQSTFNSLCTFCVARNIESSAFELGHNDDFINSHTTIRLVLSNLSKIPNPNCHISLWKMQSNFVPIKSRPSLNCGLAILLIVDIVDNQNLSNTSC